jgi:hypothetical protein
VRLRPFSAMLIAAPLLAAPIAGAQRSAVVREPGPSVAATAVSFRAPPSTSAGDLSLAAPRRGGLSRPAKLMIFGGAALLTGVLIGNDAGTVIAVGGAVVGLYGLYLYLNQPGTMRDTAVGLGYRATL